MGFLDSLGESLASKIIGQDPMTGEIPQPKAHDNINEIINTSEHKDLLMDLITGGGVGGTIKTGTKALWDLPKSTLIKQFFEKYRGKPYPRKPVTTQKGWGSEDLEGLSKITGNKNPLGEIMSTKPYVTPKGAKQPLYEFQRLVQRLLKEGSK